MSKELVDLVQNLGAPRVLVVGDVMMDRYVWGDAERISQEAPVILLRADRREERLGGASSVATMLRALGAKVMLAGIVGNDHDAGRIRQMLTDLCIDHEAVITDVDRPSTVKERYVGRAQHRHPQQMIRVDYEDRRPISEVIREQIMLVVQSQLKKTDVVLISDYDKGVCTPGLLSQIISAARAKNLKVIADPIRGHDYRKYHGCSAITPNRLEAGLASSRTLEDMNEVWSAAAHLQETLDLEAAIITLDKDGMALKHRDGRAKHFPTRPRHVYDITGAGDMVMSVLGLALASGADYDQAIQLANVAGGLEVEKIGVATVTREEILRDLMTPGHAATLSPTKVLPLEATVQELDYRRRLGQRVVFTNGCFDVLHAGHVQYLQEARAQGDVLVVGLNSDASVRALKGKTRPVQQIADRSLILASLQAVDFITVFDESTPMHLIEAIRPDVLVKGADYSKEEVVGAQFVESYGGRVHLALLHHGHSTTNLIDRMRAA
ncbi:MAG: D-glycero-beta-D-manno-heptose 1-phosphate adenylyltransferase [Planctomycetes bacterium]|nr:D-glycero-beta-D-manno-heptose 1-phosphate adenylyltransferase [Planctomycetota bacterium]